MCPHWSVVVGPTTTQPLLTNTRASFALLSEHKHYKHVILLATQLLCYTNEVKIPMYISYAASVQSIILPAAV